MGQTGKRLTSPEAKLKDRARQKRKHRSDPRKQMYRNAKRRALQRGVPFSITTDDIRIPAECPILGLPLSVGDGGQSHDGSPTLDRIVPELGYVRGNVIVISRRANNIKSNAYPAEISAVARWLETAMEEVWKNLSSTTASSVSNPTPQT